MAQQTLTKDDLILAGFRRTWALVEDGSIHFLRLHHSNLLTAKKVLAHLEEDLDELVRLVEEKIREHESLEKDVECFLQVCKGHHSA